MFWAEPGALNQLNQCGRDAPVIFPNQGLGLKGGHRESQGMWCWAGGEKQESWAEIPVSLRWISWNVATLDRVRRQLHSHTQHLNYSSYCINDYVFI